MSENHLTWRDPSDRGRTHDLVAKDHHSKINAWTFYSVTDQTEKLLFISDCRLAKPIVIGETTTDYDRPTMERICEEQLKL